MPSFGFHLSDCCSIMHKVPDGGIAQGQTSGVTHTKEASNEDMCEQHLYVLNDAIWFVHQGSEYVNAGPCMWYETADILYICPVFLRSVVEVMTPQSYPTLCDLMDCSPPGSSVHEIFQVRILEWVAIHFSRGSSWPRYHTWVSRIGGRFFTSGRKGIEASLPHPGFLLSPTMSSSYWVLTPDLVFETLPLTGKKKKKGSIICFRVLSNVVVIFDHILAFRYWSIEVTPSEPIEGNVPEDYPKISSLLTAVCLPAQASFWDIWELSK